MLRMLCCAPMLCLLCCAAIKDRIVEALDQLYINGWAGNAFTSAQAARNLVDLATGASLGGWVGCGWVGGLWLGGSEANGRGSWGGWLAAAACACWAGPNLSPDYHS